jgi:hypothetical protein
VRTLYEELYCARGECENRIKEAQLDLSADRLFPKDGEAIASNFFGQSSFATYKPVCRQSLTEGRDFSLRHPLGEKGHRLEN